MIKSPKSKNAIKDSIMSIKRKKSNIIDESQNKKIINTISELLNNMCKDNNKPEINNKNILLNKK